MVKTLFQKGPLLSERIEQTDGRATGFDYMRLLLAILIICFHSVVTAYGPDAQTDFNNTVYGKFLVPLLLPMFFTLSGFLVAGSLMRSKGITIFLGLRAFRIFPALFVDTLFCALIIGPLLTTLPLVDYIQSPELHKYFQNILGIIHYYLPGVFESNPSHLVNGQLWTIPSELECYILLSILAVLGIHRHRMLFLSMVISAMLILEFRVLYFSAEPWAGRLLPLYFLSGVLVYLFRDKVRWNAWLFGGSTILSVVFLSNPKLAYLAPLPIAYTTVYIGLKNPKKIGLLKQGDYSYGLYLYGFPVQQALVATIPFASTWYGNILLGVPMTFVLAMLSWHLVEKRVLSRKNILQKIHEMLPATPLTKLYSEGFSSRLAATNNRNS